MPCNLNLVGDVTWLTTNHHLRRANRPAPELEAIIGYFINPVVLRTQLEGSLTFREAMHRVRNTVVGAQANAEVGYRKKRIFRLCFASA